MAIRQKCKAMFRDASDLMIKKLFKYNAYTQVDFASRATILMYHSISDFPIETNLPYDNVSPDTFKKQMLILVKDEYNVISFSQLVHYLMVGETIPPKTVTITFDDGFLNNYEYAMPIMAELGIRATFFIISGSMGQRKPFSHLLWDDASYQHVANNPASRLPMSWSQVCELSSMGMEIGSHGVSHRSLGLLKPTEAFRELVESKALIEDHIGVEVTLLAYPFGSFAYGDFNSCTRALVSAAGYKASCTTEIGQIKGKEDLYALPRIPIRDDDDEDRFRTKLLGGYNWVQFPKRFFQHLVPRIDKVS